MTDWIKQTRPNYTLTPETHFSFKSTQRFKNKGWKMMIHANDKRENVGILTSDKVDFRPKLLQEK